MIRAATAAILALPAALWAQTQFFPLEDVKAGMTGTGKTVFSGERIDDFQVQILGVLKNVWPKQSLILARLSGGPLETTGVLQGMSGSPVYIDGKLVGAVSMAFPFAKEPIAGIRPIQDMLRVAEAGTEPVRRSAITLRETDLTAGFAKPEEAFGGGLRLVDIATPLSFAGFTQRTVETFAPRLRALGLEPRQGVSSGGSLGSSLGNHASLRPGSMISVALMTGDMSVPADGTVTYIDGNRVYAFGHRFLSIGPTDLPFARSEVLTLLPNLSASFKISSPKEWMGTIYQDRSTAIAGELGRRARLIPVSMSVKRAGRSIESYRMEMANDRFLAPFLTQMAVFSAIDATERSLGASSYAVRGQIEFQGNEPPLKLNNMYAGDANIAMQVSLSAAIPLAYVLQSEFSSLEIRNVALEIDSFDAKRQYQIDQVVVSPHTVRPGSKVRLSVVLVGDNGTELTRDVAYAVPVGAPDGPLYFTVADGNTTNLTELRQILGDAPRSAEQLVANVNKLRENTKAYVRVWRNEPNFHLEGEEFPDPPASAALILGAAQTPTRNSKVAELEISAGDAVVTGVKTAQVEVKE